MRTLRKIIGVIFYLIAAVALILAFFCLVEGFKSSNWFGGIAAAVIVIVVALAAFVIGWYIANPGEWEKANNTTPKKTADSKSKKETAPQRHVETPRLQSAVEKSTPQAEASPATHVSPAPIKAEPKPPANASAKEPVVSSPRIAVKANASASRTETVDGSYIGKVYVYDPKPALKMREGRETLLQVCRRNVKLKSALTRNTWSSGIDSGFAVEYKGRPFGVVFNDIAERHVRALFSAGAQTINLHAIREGWYQRGIPEVAVLLPTLDEARRKEQGNDALDDYSLREQLGIAALMPDTAFNISQTNWLAGPSLVPEEGYALFSADVAYSPVPEDSKAKPHIRISDHATHAVIADISARSADYGMANIVVDKHVRLLVSKRFSGYKAEAFSV